VRDGEGSLTAESAEDTEKKRREKEKKKEEGAGIRGLGGRIWNGAAIWWERVGNGGCGRTAVRARVRAKRRKERVKSREGKEKRVLI
jgi:hypothetical protein